MVSRKGGLYAITVGSLAAAGVRYAHGPGEQAIGVGDPKRNLEH